jgi:formate dehydrogenase (coenzyme F420) beta subunit
VANGCNSRNIVTHIIENQIKREQLYIVGIPCTGMIDHRAVSRAVGNREILEVKEEDDHSPSAAKASGRPFRKRIFCNNCAGLPPSQSRGI